MIPVLLAAAALQMADSFTVVRQVLPTVVRTVPVTTLVYRPVRTMAALPGAIALGNEDEVLILRTADRRPQPLRSLSRFADSLTWFGPLCAAGNYLVATAGVYPTEQRARDRATPRGGFVAGPRSFGLLVISTTSWEARFVAAAPIRRSSLPRRLQRTLDERAGDGDDTTSITLLGQACARRAGSLVVSVYGGLIQIDPATLNTQVLDMDAVLYMSRHSLAVRGDTMWMAMDEGGLGGGCFIRSLRGNRTPLCLLNKPTAETQQDATIILGGRVYASSRFGLVEVRERSRRQLLYVGADTTVHPGIFGLAAIGGRLWATSERGWLLIEPEGRGITRFVPSTGIATATYAIAMLGDRLLVAADSAVLSTPLPSATR